MSSSALPLSMIVFLTIIAGASAATAADKAVILKNFPMKVSQGVAVDQHHFYAISNMRITKYTKESGQVVADWQADRTNKKEAHFKHLNSGTVVGNKLYCAHSQFPTNANHNTVEIFHVGGEALRHEMTIRMPGKYGSLTWIDQSNDGSWWVCYAVYGKAKNRDTRLVQYRFEDGKFTEVNAWTFPQTVVSRWGSMSCSGGSWGADGYLYVTGHDGAEAHLLHIDSHGDLSYVKTIGGLGINGQAIAWDRYSTKRVLWGIVKNKHVTRTLVPAVRSQP